jgi:hypothetical protein
VFNKLLTIFPTRFEREGTFFTLGRRQIFGEKSLTKTKSLCMEISRAGLIPLVQNISCSKTSATQSQKNRLTFHRLNTTDAFANRSNPVLDEDIINGKDGSLFMVNFIYFFGSCLP